MRTSWIPVSFFLTGDLDMSYTLAETILLMFSHSQWIYGCSESVNIYSWFACFFNPVLQSVLLHCISVILISTFLKCTDPLPLASYSSKKSNILISQIHQVNTSLFEASIYNKLILPYLGAEYRCSQYNLELNEIDSQICLSIKYL